MKRKHEGCLTLPGSLSGFKFFLQDDTIGYIDGRLEGSDAADKHRLTSRNYHVVRQPMIIGAMGAVMSANELSPVRLPLILVPR